MAFYNSNLNDGNKMNIGREQELFATNQAGFQKSTDLVLPPVNTYCSYLRNSPQTSIQNSSLFSSGTNTDYILSCPGYTQNYWLNINVTNNAASASNILPCYLIDRVEVIDTQGNIANTVYGDAIYLAKIHQSYDLCKRIAGIEGFNLATYGATSIAAGATADYWIKLPLAFLDQDFKMNIVENRLTIRIWWSNLGCSNVTNLYCNYADMITSGFIVGARDESLQCQWKCSKQLRWRYLSAYRACQQTTAMVPGGQYYAKLTSGNGLSAYLIFFIRPQGLTNSNLTSFVPIQSVQFLDRNGTLMGITHYSDELQSIVSQKFVGDIFTINNSIYPIVFCIDTTVARNGGSSGFFQLTGNEQLLITMPSNLVAGNYVISCYSFEYNIAEMKNGRLSTVKN